MPRKPEVIPPHIYEILRETWCLMELGVPLTAKDTAALAAITPDQLHLLIKARVTAFNDGRAVERRHTPSPPNSASRSAGTITENSTPRP